MAKVELSALIDSITGKLGGSVFQGTVGGLQLRTRVSPRNPRSAYQQSNRAQWSFAALTYLTLNPAEISSWVDNAPAGSSASAFYLQTNTYIKGAGGPLLRSYTPGTPFPTIPANFDTLTPASIITEPLSAGQLLTGNECVNIFATTTLPQSTSFISPSAYSYVTTINRGTDVSAPVNISAPYIARFGGVGVTGVVGLRFYVIDIDTGIVSEVQEGRSYVT